MAWLHGTDENPYMIQIRVNVNLRFWLPSDGIFNRYNAVTSTWERYACPRTTTLAPLPGAERLGGSTGTWQQVRWRCGECGSVFDLADLRDQLEERMEAALGGLIGDRL